MFALRKRGGRGRELRLAGRLPVIESLEQRTLLSLLGVGAQLGFPDVYYDAAGRLNYVAPSETTPDGTFDTTDGAPTSFVASKGARPITIKSVSVNEPARFELHLRTDGAGNLVGGVPGPDLLVEGWIDMNKNNVIDAGDYSGVLLTGEVIQFGYYDSGGPNDNYDFRLVPTGGALMPFFVGKDIGLVMTSLNSTFVGDFSLDFSGWAQGVLGPIGALRSSLAGQVLVNGGPAGINGVAVSLTGTDITGQPVGLTTTTAQDGSYLFAGLLPGTYAISEVQPADYLDGIEVLGTLGGTLGDDVFGGIALEAGQSGTGYNFVELTCDLAVSKAGPAVAFPGDTITYTYTVVNAGPGEVTPIVIDDQLGSPSYVSGDADGDGMLDSSETWVYQAQYTIPAEAGPGTLTNAVTVSAAVAPGADTNPVNNSAAWDVRIASPGSLSGFVWVDFNDDGLIDFNEKAIANVTVTLQGVDYLQRDVLIVVQTDEDGYYSFDGLRPGVYSLIESQPAGFIDGIDALGSAGGTVGNDRFTNVVLGEGVDGVNYNFGERPTAGTTVVAGQTATIGFWQNKNGQALIKAVNAGLGDWLAATFPNLYADLAGKTNAEVAAFYSSLFKAKKTVGGPANVDCQVMAAAFAVYVTNQSLAGTAATRYGFLVTEYGVGTATWNVGLSGAAFGVSNYTTMTVLDLLLATDERSSEGRLYEYNVILRTLANAVYSAINEAGDIR